MLSFEIFIDTLLLLSFFSPFYQLRSLETNIQKAVLEPIRSWSRQTSCFLSLSPSSAIWCFSSWAPSYFYPRPNIPLHHHRHICSKISTYCHHWSLNGCLWGGEKGLFQCWFRLGLWAIWLYLRTSCGSVWWDWPGCCLSFIWGCCLSFIWGWYRGKGRGERRRVFRFEFPIVFWV